jgi:hypothetical protein
MSHIDSRLKQSILLPLLAGIGYGSFARLSFGAHLFNLSGTLTASFLYLVPLGIGAATIALAPRPLRHSRKYQLLMPLGTSFSFALFAAAAGWEWLICVFMALGLFLILAAVGGGLVLAIVFVVRAVTHHDDDSRGGLYGALVVLAVAPFLASPLESLTPLRTEYRTVDTHLVVAARPETIWANIVRVPPIQDGERIFTLSQLIGFPRPLEATYTGQGVGGMREGRFEDGLRFLETTTIWQPGRVLSLRIDPQTQAVTLPPLKAVGGEAFDVLDATYVIQPLDDHLALLRLTSTYRLTTRVNGYASLWADLIMTEFQNTILHVVAGRAEAQDSPSRP